MKSFHHENLKYFESKQKYLHDELYTLKKMNRMTTIMFIINISVIIALSTLAYYNDINRGLFLAIGVNIGAIFTIFSTRSLDKADYLHKKELLTYIEKEILINEKSFLQELSHDHNPL